MQENVNTHVYHEHPDKHHSGHDHECHSITQEIICHTPYAIFSVALGIMFLTLISYFSLGFSNEKIIMKGYKLLFHSFHFLHIVFASTGTVLMFSRYSKNLLGATLIGILSPAIFCMLSDVLLPYWGGIILGENMDFHICFIKEWYNVVPLLGIGIVNGLLLSSNSSKLNQVFSLGSHFIHIFISSLASLFYMVSHGFNHWHSHMGTIFLVLVAAVVLPCTLSDVVVPIYFARVVKRK